MDTFLHLSNLDYVTWNCREHEYQVKANILPNFAVGSPSRLPLVLSESGQGTLYFHVFQSSTNVGTQPLVGVNPRGIIVKIENPNNAEITTITYDKSLVSVASNLGDDEGQFLEIENVVNERPFKTEIEIHSKGYTEPVGRITVSAF